MNIQIQIKSFSAPEVNKKEILRYAKGNESDIKTVELMEDCLIEAEKCLTYKVCYRAFKVTTDGEICDFGDFKVNSRDLSKNLSSCKSVVLFGATVGLGIDRLIIKYGKISPVRALMLQAIGSERIESLCNLFCKELAKELGTTLKPRFSAGYGDLPLATQKDIFSVLGLEKNLGVLLGDGLLMTPTKSVTAFVGLCE